DPSIYTILNSVKDKSQYLCGLDEHPNPNIFVDLMNIPGIFPGSGHRDMKKVYAKEMTKILTLKRKDHQGIVVLMLIKTFKTILLSSRWRHWLVYSRFRSYDIAEASGSSKRTRTNHHRCIARGTLRLLFNKALEQNAIRQTLPVTAIHSIHLTNCWFCQAVTDVDQSSQGVVHQPTCPVECEEAMKHEL
ncbi:hypothetical protein C0J52_09491, partial [Blattella germanica]